MIVEAARGVEAADGVVPLIDVPAETYDGVRIYR
jgi:hypothetical protein